MLKSKQQYVRPPAVRGNTLVKRLSPQHGHLAQNQDRLPHRSQRCRSSVIHRPCQRMHDNYVSAICPSWAGLAMEAGVFMHRRCGVYTIGVSPCWVGKGHTMMSSRSLCTHSVWNSDTRLHLRSRAHLCTVLPMQDVALCVVGPGFPHYAAAHAGANLTAS